MLSELDEADATGRTAEIFAEIRRLYATPYVSSIHRHLATRPGVLEWAWDLAAPAFRNGEAQEMAWRIAERVALKAMPSIPGEALRVWGLGPGEVESVKAIATSFTRVAPLNMVFGGIVRDELRGAARSMASRKRASGAWAAPAELPPPPGMVDAGRLGEPERALLEVFRSGSGATAFVPGLYRMLAHWPGLLAHLAVELAPRFASVEKTQSAAGLIAAIDEAVAVIRTGLPGTQLPAPSREEAAHLVRMIDGYRVTSPEMILFGRLIREAMPG